MSALLAHGCVEGEEGHLSLQRMQGRCVTHNGNCLPGHAQAVAALVPGNVVCGQSKTRRQLLGLQRILGIKSYGTVWAWMHKLRTAMVRPGRDRLHGTVEVDETLVGGPKPGKRGRGASGKVLVLVAVEDREGTKQKGIGRIRLRVITDASGPTLERAVTEMVEPGSTVRTDGWTGYNGLKGKGYKHIVVQHQEEEPGQDPTPLVHRVASLLKRWLLGIHHGRVESSHLHYYLDEFTFRFNRRRARSRGKLFYELMRQALMVNPAPLSSLKAT